MNVYNSDVSRLWIISLLLGAIFGLIYDGVMQLCLSAGIKPKERFKKAYDKIVKALIFLRDFLFCILFSFCALILMYNANNGVFRWSVYFFMLLGFFIYRKTLSKIVRKILSFILIAPMWIIRKTLHILSIPIRLIFKLLDLTIGKFICIIISRMKNIRLSCKRKREEKKSKLSLMCVAESGKEEYVDIQKAQVRASRIIIRRKDA